MSTPEPSEMLPESGGVSIIRKEQDVSESQGHLGRPARLSRYALGVPGAVLVGAGIAFWIESGSAVGIAFAVFGAVLVLLAVVQHFMLRRDLAHWPTDVLLYDEGLEVTLANGEVRGTTWTEPEISLILLSRPVRGSENREVLLMWGMDSKLPSAEITVEAFDRLPQVARDHGLVVEEQRRGSRLRPTRWVHIHPRAAADTISATGPKRDFLTPMTDLKPPEQ